MYYNRRTTRIVAAEKYVRRDLNETDLEQVPRCGGQISEAVHSLHAAGIAAGADERAGSVEAAAVSALMLYIFPSSS